MSWLDFHCTCKDTGYDHSEYADCFEHLRDVDIKNIMYEIQQLRDHIEYLSEIIKLKSTEESKTTFEIKTVDYVTGETSVKESIGNATS